MRALLTAAPPASSRNPDSPADQALAKIVELLLPAGYGFTIPAWDGDAYLKINDALRAITDLTISSRGNLTWEYRSVQCPHLHPSELVGMAIEILDPDHTRREPTVGENADFPLVEIVRYALFRYGFTATIAESGDDTGPVLTAANPKQPHRPRPGRAGGVRPWRGAVWSSACPNAAVSAGTARQAGDQTGNGSRGKPWTTFPFTPGFQGSPRTPHPCLIRATGPAIRQTRRMTAASR